MTVSAALIVKNEEQNLGRCLESLKGHVDQIVIVDTGSTDRTVEIAKAGGAKIGHFTWVDDFAAARNATLPLIETDWMLHVDADDELQGEIGPLRGNRMTVSYTDSAGYSTRIPRLYKMVSGLTWKGPVHEYVAIPEPFDDHDSDLTILTHGYKPELMEAKIRRNLNILQKHLKRHPKEPHSLFYMARECAHGQFPAEGYEAATHFLQSPGLSGQLLSDGLAIAAYNAAMLGRWDMALQWTEKARSLRLESVWTEFVAGVAYMNKGQKEKAIEALEKACEMPFSDRSLLGLEPIVDANRFELLEKLRAAEG